MAFGKRQQEELNALAATAKPMKEGHVRFEVQIRARRAYTREFGGGMAIVVQSYEVYEEGEYKFQCKWIANCQYDYTALERGQEIARYLVDQGVPREHVRLFRSKKP